jgi:hypothetical protein
MAIIRSIWTSKSQGTATTYVGRKGELFYDNDSAELRYSDGVTIGGIPIVAQGGGGSGVTIAIGGYVNTAADLVDPWTGNSGDTILARDTGNLYIWDGNNWVDLGVVLGPRGYTGSVGFRGSMGFQGYSGSQGSQGIQGFVGSFGPQGPQGVIGYTGSGGSGGGGSLSSITDLVTTVTNVVSLRFDSATGLIVTNLGSGVARVSINSSLLNPNSFKSIAVTGQNTITALGADTVRFVAGANMSITTNDSASPKTITFTSTGGGGGGGASDSQPIKTFNILNNFSAPLLGSAVFAPNANDIVRSVRLTNGKIAGVDLTVGLYRNGTLLNFFTLPAGYFTYVYGDLDYPINVNDYLTVNVVSGMGVNFSLALFNI